YDDDLTDGVGIDETFPTTLVGLGYGPAATGSAVAMTNPTGETTVQFQDGLGRTVRSLTPLGHATTTSYDIAAVGGLIATQITDPLGATIESRHDGLGRERQRI